MTIGADPFFGFVAFVVTVIISRVITEHALKSLSVEEKAKLLDAFSGYRTYNYAAILILIVLYFGAMRYFPGSTSTSTGIFLVLFLTFSLTVSILSYRKLRRLGLPGPYIKNYLISLSIQYVGITLLFAPIIARYAR